MEDLNVTPPTGSESNLEDQNIDRPLHDLVKNDTFYEAVEARLENPNETDRSGSTLLHAAASSKEENSRILQLLLDRNADVDATTPQRNTPLHFAAGFRHRNAVAALIEAGASVNLKNNLGRTPLHVAIGRDWMAPPILTLCHSCDEWIVERLLSHPEIDLNAVDGQGQTPLMWAVGRQLSDVVVALLRKGADPNIPNIRNGTPLHAALSAQDPNPSIVCALLSKGVGIYCKDKFGRTPMDVFFHNLPTDTVAQHVVWWIVLRYKIRGSVRGELKKHPTLYKYFKRCCREVRAMKRRIVYGNFNLHDFACDCLHLEDGGDLLQDVYMPVVKILSSGPYREYTDFILRRMTTRDLCGVLRKTSDAPGIEKLFENSMHLAIFWAIKVLNKNSP